MSHSDSPVSLHDVQTILTAEPFKFSRVARIVLWLLLAASVVVFFIGIRGESARLYWVSLQVNFLFWLCIAAASSCFSAALQICNAQWARPLRRIFESTSGFFLWCLLPLAILYFGKQHLFIWVTERIEGKGSWLTPDFVYARDFVAILVLALLARRLVFLSLQCDLGAVRKGLTGLSESLLSRWSHRDYDTYVDGWGDDGITEIRETTESMLPLSVGIIIAYAVIMTLIAFDQIMSVDPHWYSTLFGAFIYMSAVYMAMAWCSIGVGLARELHPLFRLKVERRTLHDLGKLLFGFGIFWAYLFWSHYLTIWYGNMPEETHWVVIRLREQPWHAFAWLIFGSCFIIPFFLGLSRDVKQVPQLLAGTAMIVLVGLWLQSYLLFTPTLFPKTIPLGLKDLAIALGFLAGFLLSVESFLSRVPLMPFGDLYAKEH